MYSFLYSIRCVCHVCVVSFIHPTIGRTDTRKRSSRRHFCDCSHDVITFIKALARATHDGRLGNAEPAGDFSHTVMRSLRNVREQSGRPTPVAMLRANGADGMALLVALGAAEAAVNVDADLSRSVPLSLSALASPMVHQSLHLRFD